MKILLLGLITIIVLAAAFFSVYAITAEQSAKAAWDSIITYGMDIDFMQKFCDYGNRTDNQTVYECYSPAGVDNDTNAWMCYNKTYNDTGSLLYQQVGYGNYTNRANLTY